MTLVQAGRRLASVSDVCLVIVAIDGVITFIRKKVATTVSTSHLDPDQKLRPELGTWTAEEEKRLTGIVTEMQAAQGGADSEIFWTLVAEKMGNRGRQQCRIKW